VLTGQMDNARVFLDSRRMASYGKDRGHPMLGKNNTWRRWASLANTKPFGRLRKAVSAGSFSVPSIFRRRVQALIRTSRLPIWGDQAEAPPRECFRWRRLWRKTKMAAERSTADASLPQGRREIRGMRCRSARGRNGLGIFAMTLAWAAKPLSPGAAGESPGCGRSLHGR